MCFLLEGGSTRGTSHLGETSDHLSSNDSDTKFQALVPPLLASATPMCWLVQTPLLTYHLLLEGTEVVSTSPKLQHPKQTPTTSPLQNCLCLPLEKKEGITLKICRIYDICRIYTSNLGFMSPSQAWLSPACLCQCQ